MAPVMLMLLCLLLPSQVYKVGGLEASSWGSAAPLTLGSTLACRQKKSIEIVAETSDVLPVCSTSAQSQKVQTKGIFPSDELQISTELPSISDEKI